MAPLEQLDAQLALRRDNAAVLNRMLLSVGFLPQATASWHQQESLRSHIGMVAQDAALMHSSVSGNISYGRPDATAAQIEAAALQAEAHGFIQGLKDAQGRTGWSLSIRVAWSSTATMRRFWRKVASMPAYGRIRAAGSSGPRRTMTFVPPLTLGSPKMRTSRALAQESISADRSMFSRTTTHPEFSA